MLLTHILLPYLILGPHNFPTVDDLFFSLVYNPLLIPSALHPGPEGLHAPELHLSEDEKFSSSSEQITR